MSAIEMSAMCKSFFITYKKRMFFTHLIKYFVAN